MFKLLNCYELAYAVVSSWIKVFGQLSLDISTDKTASNTSIF